MAGAPKASSEWFFGAQHDDILDSTLRARERAQRRLEASLGGKDRGSADKVAAAKLAKTPVTDLVRTLREHIADNFDDIFDAFMEIDINGNGRLRYVAAVALLQLLLRLCVPACVFALRPASLRCHHTSRLV